MASVRFEELSRTNVESEGDSGGAWVEVRGRFHVAIDSSHEVNAKVRGINHFAADAPVECEADVLLITPEEPAAATCTVLDIANRGLPLSWFICNQAPFARLDQALPSGDGFMQEQGMAFAVCGWQSCLAGRPGMYSLRAPSAKNADGTPLTGMMMVECDTSTHHFEFPGLPTPDRRNLPLSSRGHCSMSAADDAEETARLFVLRTANDKSPVEVERSKWRFGSFDSEGTFVPGKNGICMEEGFEKGKVYQLFYKGSCAIVTGLQQAVIREFAAWLKFGGGIYGSNDPMPVIVVGGSQSGRFLRSWIADDFLVDAHGRDVADGIAVWVAGSSRGQFNMVFGQAAMSMPHLAVDRFPFSPVRCKDGDEEAGLHDKIRARGSMTKVIYTNTSIEYHRGDASLLHTTPDGTADLLVDEEDTRVYMLAGCPHNPNATWPPSYADGMPPGTMIQQNLTIAHSFAQVYRQQLVLLLQWVVSGTAPPPSCHPKLSDGTLVSHREAYGFFDAVPSAHPPGKEERASLTKEGDCVSYSRLWKRDYGLSDDGLCTALPPVDGTAYEGSLVPAVDKDGIDKGGIRIPVVLAPLCSYTGWALRHPDFGGEASILMVSGSSIPFPKSKGERDETGDPRLAVTERYASKEDYAEHVLAAARELAAARFIRQEDVGGYAAVADRAWDWLSAL